MTTAREREREREEEEEEKSLFFSFSGGAARFGTGERSKRASAPRDEEVLTEVAAAEKAPPERASAGAETFCVGRGSAHIARGVGPCSTPC